MLGESQLLIDVKGNVHPHLKSKKNSVSLTSKLPCVGLQIRDKVVPLPLDDDARKCLNEKEIEQFKNTNQGVILSGGDFFIGNREWITDTTGLMMSLLRGAGLEENFSVSSIPKLLIIPEGGSYHYLPKEESGKDCGTIMIGLPSSCVGGDITIWDSKNARDPKLITRDLQRYYTTDIMYFLAGMDVNISTVTKGAKLYVIYKISSSNEVIPSVTAYSGSIDYAIKALSTWVGNSASIRLPKVYSSISKESKEFIEVVAVANLKLKKSKKIDIFVEFKSRYGQNSIEKYFFNIKEKKLVAETTCLESANTQLEYDGIYSDESDDSDDSSSCGCGYSDSSDDYYGIFGSHCCGECGGGGGKDKQQYKLIISKKPFTLEMLRENCSVASFISFLSTDSTFSIEKFYEYLLKYNKDDFKSLKVETFINIFSKFLCDTNKYLSLLKHMFSESDITKLIKILNVTAGVKYTESQKFTTFDWEDSKPRFPGYNQLWCSSSNPKFKQYKDEIIKGVPVYLKQSNGVIFTSTFEFRNTGAGENITVSSEQVFYHPDFELIRKTVNEIVKVMYSREELSFADFLTIISYDNWVDYFDLAFLISRVGSSGCSSYSNISNSFDKILDDKHWTPEVSKNFYSIVKHISASQLVELIMHLYVSEIEFKQTIANELIPTLLDKLKETSSLRCSAYTFFGLCCYSNSFEVAEIGKKYGIVGVLSGNIKEEIARREIKELQNIPSSVIDEWHKYFIKAQFDELVKQAEDCLEIIPVNHKILGRRKLKYPERWIEKNNIDQRYYTITRCDNGSINVQLSPAFQKSLRNRDLTSEIDKFKQRYPFLYLGKRVAKAVPNPPAKKQK